MASRTMLPTRKWPLEALPLHSRGPGYLLGFHLCEAPAMSFELILPFLRPIEGLLLDDSISEIMGNPDSSWWCERDGKMHQEDAVSFDTAKLLTGLEVIANQLGKKLDEDNPSLHAQLPDGSRLYGTETASIPRSFNYV